MIPGPYPEGRHPAAPSGSVAMFGSESRERLRQAVVLQPAHHNGASTFIVIVIVSPFRTMSIMSERSLLAQVTFAADMDTGWNLETCASLHR